MSAARNDLTLAVAEAMWKVGEGYTVEDWGDRGEVDWSSENANDVADKALYLGYAEQVLDHLLATGWTPPATHVSAEES